MKLRYSLFAVTLLLAGCDLDALLADPRTVKKETEAKAIGSACRHGLRSIEDCYALNEKAPKGAVFAGWKEMDQYMRDNKIEGIEPKGLKPPPPISVATVAPGEEVVEPSAKAESAAGSKKPAKAEKEAPHKAKAEL